MFHKHSHCQFESDPRYYAPAQWWDCRFVLGMARFNSGLGLQRGLASEVLWSHVTVVR